jgi:large subunit ribosomal protein L18e
MKRKRTKIMNNIELLTTITVLKKASKSTNNAIWKALAEELDKPKRRRVKVNLSRINRYTKEGQIVAVPGKVLASGTLDHAVKVAAYEFSEMAKKKIELIKGESMSLNELLESGIEPRNIKIMK